LRHRGLLDALGGRSTLLRIQAATPASANAEHYAEIVSELSLLRRLIGVAHDIAEMGYAPEDDVADTLDRAEAMVFEVAEHRVADSMTKLYPALEQTMDELAHLYERDSNLTGVPTGYTDIDAILLGLQPSNLVIVAARPGQGKTSFAMGAAAHVALETNKPVLFFSLEMGHLELTRRLLAAEAHVDVQGLQTGRLSDHEWTKLNQAVGRLADDLHVGLAVEEQLEPSADHAVVVGDHDPHAAAPSRSSMVVPRPGADSTQKRPPASTARS